jgi:hypothetical protein
MSRLISISPQAPEGDLGLSGAVTRRRGHGGEADLPTVRGAGCGDAPVLQRFAMRTGTLRIDRALNGGVA